MKQKLWLFLHFSTFRIHPSIVNRQVYSWISYMVLSLLIIKKIIHHSCQNYEAVIHSEYDSFLSVQEYKCLILQSFLYITIAVLWLQTHQMWTGLLSWALSLLWYCSSAHWQLWSWWPTRKVCQTRISTFSQMPLCCYDDHCETDCFLSFGFPFKVKAEAEKKKKRYCLFNSSWTLLICVLCTE